MTCGVVTSSTDLLLRFNDEGVVVSYTFSATEHGEGWFGGAATGIEISPGLDYPRIGPIVAMAIPAPIASPRPAISERYEPSRIPV